MLVTSEVCGHEGQYGCSEQMRPDSQNCAPALADRRRAAGRLSAQDGRPHRSGVALTSIREKTAGPSPGRPHPPAGRVHATCREWTAFVPDQNPASTRG